MPQNQFNKPIGSWLEETETVEEVVSSFDPKTQKLSPKIEPVTRKVKVQYERPSVDFVMCKDFEHVWYVMDRHTYAIKCRNCPLHKRIMPGIEYIDKDGHVRLKDDDRVIA